MLNAKGGQESFDISTMGGLTSALNTSRASRWLDARIKKGRNSIFSEVTQLTPELATLLLGANDGNRHLDKRSLRQYQTDIEEDRFVLNGEPIIVSDTGELNDGQHRCMAVIGAQKAIETIIVFGVPRETRLTVDEGKARTTGDYLSMDGIGDQNNVAATAAKLMEIAEHRKLVTGNDRRPTKQQIREYALDHLDEIQRSLVFCKLNGHTRIGSLSLLATAHYLLSQIDQQDADSFIEKLIDGTGLGSRHPIWVAREKFADRKLRLNNNEKLKTIFTAWNHYRTKSTVRQIYHSMKRTDKLPEIR